MDVVKRFRFLFTGLVLSFALVYSVSFSVLGMALGGGFGSFILFPIVVIPAILIVRWLLRVQNKTSYWVSVLGLSFLVLFTLGRLRPSFDISLFTSNGTFWQWCLTLIPALKYLIEFNGIEFLLALFGVVFVILSLYTIRLFFKPEIKNLYFNKDQINN